MHTTGKIALITGGSRGLGRNMAQHLAKEGHDVVVTYNASKEEAETLVKEIESNGVKAAALKLDVGDIASLTGFTEEVSTVLKSKFGKEHFDFLVNNAGMGATIPFVKATEEDVDRFYNVHYKGVFFLTQKLLPLMNDGGRIINLSTGTTRFANPGYAIYASMKSAIETLTRYMAKELGPRKIAVNVVAPGPVETDFNGAFIRNNPDRKAMMAANTALGRVGEPDDIGGVVAFLCSEDARWINGQRIEVSGGINL
ncbi:MAG TPA: SDR family oxidoreductase [Chitinophagales bacterium]|nr:SDR family oxidoreductase [Chitinophagales bacterium]